MKCIKCGQVATSVVPTEYKNLTKVFACSRCIDEVKKDFSLSFVYNEKDELKRDELIQNKYKI